MLSGPLVDIQVPQGQQVTLGPLSTPHAFRIQGNQLFLNVTPDYEVRCWARWPLLVEGRPGGRGTGALGGQSCLGPWTVGEHLPLGLGLPSVDGVALRPAGQVVPDTLGPQDRTMLLADLECRRGDTVVSAPLPGRRPCPPLPWDIRALQLGPLQGPHPVACCHASPVLATPTRPPARLSPSCRPANPTTESAPAPHSS